MSASVGGELLCMDCGAPMDEVKAVVVLASLAGHSIFQCEWCGHITLLAKTPAAATSADWLHAASTRCRRGISRMPPLPVEALSA